MSSDQLAPGEQTIHFLGDVHWGAIIQSKLALMKADLDGGYEKTLPVARVHVGDLTAVAQNAQFVNALAWLASLPDVTGDLPLSRNWVGVPGNHDFDQAAHAAIATEDEAETIYDYDGTTLDWETGVGVEPDLTVDLDWVRLVMVGWAATSARLTADQMTWLDAQLDAAGSQECWIVMHAPLYGTVGGPVTGRRRVYSSYLSGFHTNGPSPDAESAAVKAVIAGHDNARAVFSGHTHSPIYAPGCATSLTLGGKAVANLNCSGLLHQFPAVKRRADPVRSPYVTRTDDGIEIRWRDHGIGGWVGPQPGVRVERIAL